MLAILELIKMQREKKPASQEDIEKINREMDALAVFGDWYLS